MKIRKIASTALVAAVMAGSMVFVQCGDGTTTEGRQARPHPKFERVDRETPEMQAKRAEFSERGIAKLNQAVKEGKIEQARADLILKWMAHDNAFKDANPEWTKYFFAHFNGRKNGQKCEGVQGEKKAAGAKAERPKKDRPEMKDRPKKERPAMKDRPEMKGDPAEMYQKFVDGINKKVQEGKIEQDHADFILKWMASNKAFADANPEWKDIGFKGFHGKKGPKGKKAS